MRDNGYRTIIFEDLGRIDAAAWDRLVGADPDANPFLHHAFLHALQSSGAATADTGWLAQFVTLWRNDRLAAAVPLYAKSHSYGEYVFDWSWAEAQERRGMPYYPKWLVAVPFTPVAGTRLIAADAPARHAAIAALLGLVRRSGLSSLHILFAPSAQTDALAQAGMLIRSNLQFHWRNHDYENFDAFLAALTQPKRKNIRAERRKVREAGIDLQRRTGRGITEDDWRFFLHCYENTYAVHGATPYLSLEFFQTIAERMPEHMMLVRATHLGRPIACALAMFDRRRSVLYGRYWGATAYVPCLHFECCYYQMIEFAIEQGLQVFEGGAQGAHKLARGLDPVETRSAHWLLDPRMHAAVQQFVMRERDTVASTIDEMSEHRALRTQRLLCNP